MSEPAEPAKQDAYKKLDKANRYFIIGANLHYLFITIMTQFEELLLKTGSPDLIRAFIREHRENLSKDFAQNFDSYCEQFKRLQDDVCLDSGIPDMEIEEFLDLYGVDMSSSLKTRTCNGLQSYGIDVKTVRDLLRWSEADIARIYNLGKKSVRLLKKAVENAGYQLKK